MKHLGQAVPWLLPMATGLALGRLLPGLNDALDRIKIDTTSLPIAIGLLGMMYPVLAKVRYNRLGDVTADLQAACRLWGIRTVRLDRDEDLLRFYDEVRR